MITMKLISFALLFICVGLIGAAGTSDTDESEKIRGSSSDYHNVKESVHDKEYDVPDFKDRFKKLHPKKEDAVKQEFESAQIAPPHKVENIQDILEVMDKIGDADEDSENEEEELMMESEKGTEKMKEQVENSKELLSIFSDVTQTSTQPSKVVPKKGVDFSSDSENKSDHKKGYVSSERNQDENDRGSSKAEKVQDAPSVPRKGVDFKLEDDSHVEEDDPVDKAGSVPRKGVNLDDEIDHKDKSTNDSKTKSSGSENSEMTDLKTGSVPRKGVAIKTGTIPRKGVMEDTKVDTAPVGTTTEHVTGGSVPKKGVGEGNNHPTGGTEGHIGGSVPKKGVGEGNNHPTGGTEGHIGGSVPKKGVTEDDFDGMVLKKGETKHNPSSGGTVPRKGAVEETGDDVVSKGTVPKKGVIEDQHKYLAPESGDSNITTLPSQRGKTTTSVTTPSPVNFTYVSKSGVYRNNTKKKPVSTVDVSSGLVHPSNRGNVHMEPVENHRSFVPMVVGALFATLMIITIAVLSLKRLRDVWSRRHYNRMDFLIDGMYGDV